MRRSSFISRVHPFRLCLIAATAVALPLLARRKGAKRKQALGSAVPRTPEQIAAAAQARGLRIPPACADGVTANLALLAGHAERMRGNPAGAA